MIEIDSTHFFSVHILSRFLVVFCAPPLPCWTGSRLYWPDQAIAISALGGHVVQGVFGADSDQAVGGRVGAGVLPFFRTALIVPDNDF